MWLTAMGKKARDRDGSRRRTSVSGICRVSMPEMYQYTVGTGRAGRGGCSRALQFAQRAFIVLGMLPGSIDRSISHFSRGRHKQREVTQTVLFGCSL